jgi:hypothetical protein
MSPIRNPFESFSFGDIYRPKNLFQGVLDQNEQSSGTVTEDPEPSYEGRDWTDYLSQLNDLYSKEGPAQSAYREHVSSMPSYQAPGKMGRLYAALMGGSEGYQRGAGAGFEAAQDVLTTPYRGAMAEWSARGKALEEQAQIENQMTGRQIQFMREARSLAKDEDEYSRFMQQQALRERQQTDLQAWRAQQTENARRSGMDTRVDQFGNLIQYDPLDPTKSVNLGPGIQATQLKNEAERLGISRANLGLSQQRLGLEGQRVDLARQGVDISRQRLETSKQREERLKNAPKRQTGISVDQQNKAKLTAAQNAAAYGASKGYNWDNYIDNEGNVKWDVARKYPQGFKDFQAIMDRYEAEILGRVRPGFIVPDEEELEEEEEVPIIP